MPYFQDPMAEIKHRFTNHPPRDRRIANELDRMTQTFIDLAIDLEETLVNSREKSLAISKLEECSMWTKACIAREQEACIAKWEES